MVLYKEKFDWAKFQIHETNLILQFKLTLQVEECRRQPFPFQFSEGKNLISEEFCSRQIYPAILIDVAQDSTEVGKLWDDQLILESLRYQVEVCFDSPGKKFDNIFFDF